jgi:hypothetical protein
MPLVWCAIGAHKTPRSPHDLILCWQGGSRVVGAWHLKAPAVKREAEEDWGRSNPHYLLPFVLTYHHLFTNSITSKTITIIAAMRSIRTLVVIVTAREAAIRLRQREPR